jgi:A/G-specific adenine glycosylase
MDLGATICTPKSPACVLCPLRAGCRAAGAGLQQTFPRKAAKKEGAVRRGNAYVIRRADGALLVGTRPPRGLLGGMTEVPGSVWQTTAGFPDPAPPLQTDLRRVGIVTHTFTHFTLELAVYAGPVTHNARLPEGLRWLPPGDVDEEAFPTLFRKVLALA